MVFQLVGVGSLGVCNDIQVYGDRITHSMGDDCILQLNDGNYELFDDEGEFMPNIYNGSLKIREHHFEYEFTEEDYINNGIEVQTTEHYQHTLCVCLLLMKKLEHYYGGVKKRF